LIGFPSLLLQLQAPFRVSQVHYITKVYTTRTKLLYSRYSIYTLLIISCYVYKDSFIWVSLVVFALLCVFSILLCDLYSTIHFPACELYKRKWLESSHSHHHHNNQMNSHHISRFFSHSSQHKKVGRDTKGIESGKEIEYSPH